MSELEIKVEQSLQTLHNALTNLEPAIDHIQSVMEVSETAKNIIRENISFLNTQKSISIEYKNELITSFNEEVEIITKKTNEVLKGIENAENNIISENLNFLSKQKTFNEEYKNELVSSFKEKVDNISIKSSEVLDGVKSSTIDIITLDKSLNNYLENIKKIDFPARLTSIDRDMSATTSALNNVQGTINNVQNEIVRLEREMKADFYALKGQMVNDKAEMLQKLDFISKENKNLKILMIITAIMSLVAVITNFI